MFEIAVALKKAETARIFIDEGRNLQSATICHGPPQPFPLAGQHLEPGNLAYARTQIVVSALVDHTAKMRRAHRGEAQTIDSHTSEKGAFRVDNRGVSRPDGKTIGASHAF